MPKNTLSEKEKQFCYYMANGRGIKKSAALSGYSSPLIWGLRLAADPKIKKHIEELSGSIKQSLEVSDGLRTIAFGDISDAVRLATAKDVGELDIDALDLQMVSELKFSKNGGIEIKFFDRIKALEKLNEVSDASDQGNDFLEALKNSVQNGEELEA